MQPTSESPRGVHLQLHLINQGPEYFMRGWDGKRRRMQHTKTMGLSRQNKSRAKQADGKRVDGIWALVSLDIMAALVRCSHLVTRQQGAKMGVDV